MLPVYQHRARKNTKKPWALFSLFVLSSLLLASQLYLTHSPNTTQRAHKLSPAFKSSVLSKCRALSLTPGPPPLFNNRTASERFVKGTKPVLIKGAKIWTGRVQGMEVISGDVLLDGGIVKAVGIVEDKLVQSYGKELVTVDAKGAWVTPGIVDMHSHLGVDSVPELAGTSDTNSRRGPILPWLRSLDGLNTHDDAYALSIAGGVTSALVLPGSANAIGGQGFVIKLRPTAERSPTSMLLEPPYTLNGTDYEFEGPPRWRQMKHACGENPSRVYSGTRMDNIWAFRQAYNHASLLRSAQDTYCSNALSNDWSSIANLNTPSPFPEDLQWEALVDVLRGRVKVHVHCYETVDLDDVVRLTNEFKFPIAAFHHAHETYLVPDLLKKAYGHPPVSAIFATNARYKRESYRGSEFAARILADNGLGVVMKSDHPVLNSRYLLYEAQQAHYYGLSSNLALASVTSTPAETIGLEHRIGFVKPGYDADLVIWDSHPLSLGATPKQVYIDGIPQLSNPYTLNNKPPAYQRVPKTPDFEREAREAVRFEGLPPLEAGREEEGVVVFENVGRVYVRSEGVGAGAKEGAGKIVKVFDSEEVSGDAKSGTTTPTLATAVVQAGKLICYGLDCSKSLHSLLTSSSSTTPNVTYINTHAGALQPGLASFGSALGLEHIQGEVSTKDGYVFDPLRADAPGLVGEETVVRAVDGLEFASRDALLAYKSGVTHALIAPLSRGFTSGLATAFSLSAPHKLAPGALLQAITALHVNIGTMSSGVPSVSTQIGVLRRLLGEGERRGVWGDVAKGNIPLVVSTQSLDIISSLILLKKDLSASSNNNKLKLTIATASEAHLVAKELGEADIGVVLIPSRPFPETWEGRRILPGPPLTQESQITQLLKHNVTVGIGILEPWSARSTRFDVGWAALESDGSITREDAIALASSNLESLLGLNLKSHQADIVVTQGGDVLEFESKVVGVVSPSRGVVDLF